MLAMIAWVLWISISSLLTMEPKASFTTALTLGSMAFGAFLIGKRLPIRKPILNLSFGVTLSILSLVAISKFDFMGKASSFPFFSSTNLMSAALACSFLLLIPQILGKVKLAQRGLAIACAVVLLAAIFLLKSRGAWLSLLGLLPLLPLLLSKQKKFKIGWAVFLVVALVAAFLFRPKNLTEQPIQSKSALTELQSITDLDQNFSNRERLMRWKIAWRIASSSPVVGIGSGNYAKRFKYYLESPKEVEQISYWHGWKGGAHSDTLNLLAETGFIGLALFLAFLVLCFFQGNALHSPSTNARLHSILLFLAIFSFLIHGMFEDLFSSPLLVALFFGMLGQIQGLQNQEKEKPQSSF